MTNNLVGAPAEPNAEYGDDYECQLTSMLACMGFYLTKYYYLHELYVAYGFGFSGADITS